MSEFPVDATNKYKDSRNFGSSGLTAGVESGLGMVEKLKRGTIQAQQETHGSTFRQASMDESAGSDNGKSFDFRY